MKERRLCGARAHWPWCAWRCCCCCGPGEPWGRRCSRSSPPGPGRRTGCPTSRTSTSTWRSSSTAALSLRTPRNLKTLKTPRKLPTPQEPHQQTPRNPYQRMLRNPPDRPPGNPNLRPPPRAPGPSQPVTPAMSRAEMAGAHRGPVPEKLDVRMALS
ncbi:chitin-binding lectin 1 isoform X9 [Canis lupus familiaris]|uniref:chitin-binding lectin 1 isoform X9 n=1 Tax=Canis lupus familiaris TaxID=9615 RepID=UPI000BAA02A3|nr:chitin-binding lectin 1 isoform X9 [Canis lupus familiaris]XP_038403093.1 chitin-binding lectin 1 isoform X9 [Canis lupus familiaris]XP_038532243.1 chitin-binding lectin 1 isoform X9 [Canis lupus familiaris]|eukprot:XP_022278635.1 chitin-binding lectin 1 isoform X9 [Canis lupus familiaris]